MFFWNCLIQWMLSFWSLVLLPFLNPAWTSGSSWFTYCRSLAWQIECYFVSVWNECNCVAVWTFFGIAFLWDWNENWPFPVPWPLLSFPNFLTYWVQHFHTSSFRIWNSSAGIPSPPLALWRPTWLHIPGCLALGECSHHCGYLGH